MSMFYRVLYTPEHCQNWNTGGRTSFHHASVGDWMCIWERTGSRTATNYPLVTVSGTYTDAARQHFIATAQARNSATGWPPDDVRSSSELDGLCAFDTPAGLSDWYTAAHPAVVIEFEGAFVCSAPDGAGAVVARFSRETNRWTTFDLFKAHFNL